ncbi:uncharacterized protein LOC108681332 [Hyalella azteca]|uniref:Uncharacterized protein LOC108681332 n=1 Tax=Hyalella azteca TaxID=294128 RepID=A0A8B7PK67_HYAAZ|nr:uncharacterized protein LOC108681332 [Hyalella azteca]
MSSNLESSSMLKISSLLNEVKSIIVKQQEQVTALPCGHPCVVCQKSLPASEQDTSSHQIKSDSVSDDESEPNHNCDERLIDDVFLYDFCSSHGHILENWCCKCQVAICKNCPNKHYTHGVVVASEMFHQEMAEKLVNSNFRIESGVKLVTSVKESMTDCDEGLRLTKEAQKVGEKLKARKMHLTKQLYHIRELSRAIQEQPDSTTLQENHWQLCKVISRADEEYRNLANKIQAMCFDLAKLETKLNETYKVLQECTTPILPEEFMKNSTSWTITGEYEACKALATLNTSDHKPSGPVVVTSTSEKPIKCLSELLMRLGKGGHQMKIKLLDSFWSKETPLADCVKLEPFLKEGYGYYLLSFMGHLRECTLQNLRAKYLQEIGLRLEAASDVELFNKSPVLYCSRHVSISKKLAAEDLQTRIKAGKNLCIYVVALEDNDVDWFFAVLEKLLPEKSETEIYLPACGLTYDGVTTLLEIVAVLGRVKRLVFEKEIFSANARMNLVIRASQLNIGLEWAFTRV